jgi:Zn-dependent metalloprotease
VPELRANGRGFGRTHEGRVARGAASADDFEVKRVDIDELRMAHTHVRQTVAGVPVWEGEAIVHLDQAGEVAGMTDELKDNLAINTTPNFTERQAIRIAKRDYTGSAEITDRPVAELMIFRAQDRAHLTDRVETPRCRARTSPLAVAE